MPLSRGLDINSTRKDLKGERESAGFSAREEQKNGHQRCSLLLYVPIFFTVYLKINKYDEVNKTNHRDIQQLYRVDPPRAGAKVARCRSGPVCRRRGGRFLRSVLDGAMQQWNS